MILKPCLSPAVDPLDVAWARGQVRLHHYLHNPVDPRCCPFIYIVRIQSEPIGCLVFGRTEATACFQGGLTYGGAADVRSGRARFDRWELLNLARVWFSPRVQPGGDLYGVEFLPGFTDRKGQWRSSLASETLRDALCRVGFDYLMRRPPCFLDEPYAIRAVLSYCDTRLHRGTIYRAAGFRLARCNRAGIETWFTTSVAGLTAAEDFDVRQASERSPRSIRLRSQRMEGAVP